MDKYAKIAKKLLNKSRKRVEAPDDGGGTIPSEPEEPTEPEPEIVTVEEFEDKPIPYETIEQENSELEQGVSNVIQNGVDGIERTVYNVTYTDDVETDREVVSVEITKEPINEIVEIGTYVEPEPTDPEPDPEVPEV